MLNINTKQLLGILAAFAISAASALAQSESEIQAGPPPKDLPSVPAWGFLGKPETWLVWHNGNVQISQKGSIDVVFIGDSLTWGWTNTGKATWEKEFVPMRSVNYGIGGDSTRQVLWRLGHGTIDGIKPAAKVLVLMIGTNNLYNDYNSGSNEEIAEGTKKIIELVQEKSPDTKILLLSMLPRQNKYFCDRVAAINGILSTFSSPDKVKYLNVGGDFADENGNVNKDFFTADLIHLSSKGYEHLATLVKPAIEELLR
ncbi:MAG TPA: GDSL-type esterase/lipase family protein [Candidatus Methylacidiphilales bacterium]|nr:GDSL-type esterase/lipase family protein [Candidatus Methylacidiphilales bacterium]